MVNVDKYQEVNPLEKLEEYNFRKSIVETNEASSPKRRLSIDSNQMQIRNRLKTILNESEKMQDPFLPEQTRPPTFGKLDQDKMETIKESLSAL